MATVPASATFAAGPRLLARRTGRASARTSRHRSGIRGCAKGPEVAFRGGGVPSTAKEQLCAKGHVFAALAGP